MKDLHQNIRLTDELERQLMLQAIEEQFRFRPTVALKNLASKVTGLFSHGHGHAQMKSAH
ncbi:hypothetical protein [Candidimonas nitroreducens]|uniref:Uncharacterized protein n=1 Tax=Candidimonas nitroreducens TaxID=683354 RepID=A0A225M8H7_9BURK|nr:hypothetical protein [Candidimonas nitroreducens]OWT57416.1 hypothetical protein CEY11_15960 [Candidimonas nitroreducens]